MKISEIISKQVLSLFEADINLVVYKPVISYDFKKVKGFVLFDIEEKEYFLPFKSIHSLKDLVVIKNQNALKDYIDLNDDSIGKKIFNSDGMELGYLIDIEIDENGNILKLITSKQNIEEFSILNNTNCLVLKGEKIVPKNLRPKQKILTRQKENSLVSIMEESLIPNKEIGNTNILLGRKLTKDIIASNAEIIAKKNQIINDKIIVVAKKYNKINQLFFSSI